MTLFFIEMRFLKRHARRTGCKPVSQAAGRGIHIATREHPASMNTFRLILRNLTFFRASSLAVIAGTAVAAAVLTGAMMVGDSVRGSLQALAVERLGKTDEALVATQFFDESLAARL